MEPYRIVNLEARTAAVVTGATTEAAPIGVRVPGTRFVRAPETTLPGYILQLESLLGRRWDGDDLIRMRDDLAAVVSHGFTLEDVVESRLTRMRGQTHELERQLAATLLGYYRLFYAALPAATEVSSIRIQRAPTWGITADLWDAWTQMEMEMEMEAEMEMDEEMEMEMEMAAENSMREMNEGISMTPHEEEIVVEQLKKLKTRVFDGEDERQENEQETRKFDGEDERHEDEQETCSVCLEDLYRGTVTTLDCRHEFHFDCLRTWLLGGRNACPLCRARAITIRGT